MFFWCMIDALLDVVECEDVEVIVVVLWLVMGFNTLCQWLMVGWEEEVVVLMPVIVECAGFELDDFFVVMMVCVLLWMYCLIFCVVFMWLFVGED